VKCISVMIAAALLTSAAFAQQQQQPAQNGNQMQVEQQACQGDVYALCGEAIPDQDRIEKCLRKKWSKVSHKCRKVMASYGRRHHADQND
jgi:hypothetical protein